MKSSRQIAEELFGPPTHVGWRARAGHAISDARFEEVVEALDEARFDGQVLQKRAEANIRLKLVARLKAVRAQRDKLVDAVAQTKSSMDVMEFSFTAEVVEMLRVMEDEIQAPAIAHHQ